jgi:hypothetical protein
MSIYNTHMEINGVEDVPIQVMYVSHRAIAGARDGRGGLKIEPDEPAHLEIECVVAADGREVTLTSQQERSMEEEICDWLSGMYDEPEPEGYHDET